MDPALPCAILAVVRLREIRRIESEDKYDAYQMRNLLIELRLAFAAAEKELCDHGSDKLSG